VEVFLSWLLLLRHQTESRDLWKIPLQVCFSSRSHPFGIKFDTKLGRKIQNSIFVNYSHYHQKYYLMELKKFKLIDNILGVVVLLIASFTYLSTIEDLQQASGTAGSLLHPHISWR
jgi:hypothetical protein